MDTPHIRAGFRSAYRVVRQIGVLVRPFWYYLLGFVAVSVLWACDLTFRPYLSKWIMNAASQGATEATIAQISLYASLFCSTLAVIFLLFRFYDWLVMRMEPVLRTRIADVLLAHVMGHGHRFYQREMAGGLVNHINAVVRGVPHLVRLVFDRGVSVLIMLLLALGAMWQFHPLIALMMGVWAALFMGVSCLVVREARRLTDRASDAQSAAMGVLTDVVTNLQVVRTFAGEEYERARLRNEFCALVDAERARDWLLLKVQTFYVVSFVVLQACSMAILIFEFKRGRMTPGDFSLILGISLSLIWVLWGMVQDLTSFVKTFGEVAQGLTILMQPHELQDSAEAQSLSVVRGDVVWSGVTFGYTPGEPLFHDLTLQIPAGQKVGIVGFSGSGKSTLVNLLLRLFDVQGGAIRIDGQDIRGVTQQSLRKAIALIPQDPSLFNRSVKENIRYAMPEADDAAVYEAARRAHAESFIQELPQGYDTMVGDRGASLSGGQRQRIAIARAFLKQAPMLILDEATSALDSVTERYIQDSMEQLMTGRTTLVIAHRLSTLLRMDRIIVLDKGAIAEDGSHDELLQYRGLYYTLWQAQARDRFLA